MERYLNLIISNTDELICNISLEYILKQKSERIYLLIPSKMNHSIEWVLIISNAQTF